MQFTCGQSFIKSIMILASLMILREFVLSYAALLLHAPIQRLLDTNPVVMCGLLNQRPSSILAIITLLLFGLSKVALLVDPLAYQSLNHEQVSIRCLLGVSVYFVVDVVLYIVLGNSHYCHPPTIKQLARKFDFKLDLDKTGVYVSSYHRAIDLCCLLCVIIIELATQILAWRKNRQVHQNPPNLPIVTPIQQLSENPPKIPISVSRLVQTLQTQLSLQEVNPPLQRRWSSEPPPPPKRFKLISMQASLATLLSAGLLLVVRYALSHDLAVATVTIIINATVKRVCYYVLPLTWVLHNPEVLVFAKTKARALMEQINV